MAKKPTDKSESSAPEREWRDLPRSGQSLFQIVKSDEPQRGRWHDFRIIRSGAGRYLAPFTTDQMLDDLLLRAAESGEDAEKLRKAAEQFAALTRAGWSKYDQWRLLHLYASKVESWRRGSSWPKKDERLFVIEDVQQVINQGSLGLTGKTIGIRATDNLITKAAHAAMSDPDFPELPENVRAIVEERVRHKTRGRRT